MVELHLREKRAAWAWGNLSLWISSGPLSHSAKEAAAVQEASEDEDEVDNEPEAREGERQRGEGEKL